MDFDEIEVAPLDKKTKRSSMKRRAPQKKNFSSKVIAQANFITDLIKQQNETQEIEELKQKFEESDDIKIIDSLVSDTES